MYDVGMVSVKKYQFIPSPRVILNITKVLEVLTKIRILIKFSRRRGGAMKKIILIMWISIVSICISEPTWVLAQDTKQEEIMQLIKENKVNSEIENQVGIQIVLDMEKYEAVSKEVKIQVKKEIKELLKSENTICFITDNQSELTWKECEELIGGENSFQIEGLDKTSKNTWKHLKVILVSTTEIQKEIVEFRYDMGNNHKDAIEMISSTYFEPTKSYTTAKGQSSKFVVVNTFDFGKYGELQTSLDLKKFEYESGDTFWVINGCDSIQSDEKKYQETSLNTIYQVSDSSKEIIADYVPSTESHSELSEESIDVGDKFLEWKIDYSQLSIIDNSSPGEGICKWDFIPEKGVENVTYIPAMGVFTRDTLSLKYSYQMSVAKSFLGIKYGANQLETGKFLITYQ